MCRMVEVFDTLNKRLWTDKTVSSGNANVLQRHSVEGTASTIYPWD